MNEFEISVDGKAYKGELQQFGYSYRIMIVIDEVQVIFEPDEERNFRAMVAPDQVNIVDAGVLKAIATELTAVLK